MTSTTHHHITDELEALAKEAEATLATVVHLDDLHTLRVDVLGRKGKLSQIKRNLKDIPPEQRIELGQQANTLSDTLEAKISEKQEALELQALTA